MKPPNMTMQEIAELAARRCDTLAANLRSGGFGYPSGQVSRDRRSSIKQQYTSIGKAVICLVSDGTT